jgi:hypothetical protein
MRPFVYRGRAVLTFELFNFSKLVDTFSITGPTPQR